MCVVISGFIIWCVGGGLLLWGWLPLRIKDISTVRIMILIPLHQSEFGDFCLTPKIAYNLHHRLPNIVIGN